MVLKVVSILRNDLQNPTDKLHYSHVSTVVTFLMLVTPLKHPVHLFDKTPVFLRVFY